MVVIDIRSRGVCTAGAAAHLRTPLAGPTTAGGSIVGDFGLCGDDDRRTAWAADEVPGYPFRDKSLRRAVFAHQRVVGGEINPVKYFHEVFDLDPMQVVGHRLDKLQRQNKHKSRQINLRQMIIIAQLVVRDYQTT